MPLDESTKQKLIDCAVEALRKDGTVEGEVQQDSHGFNYVTVRAFSAKVSVDMKINISPHVVIQLGLDTAQVENEGARNHGRDDDQLTGSPRCKEDAR